jgi:leucyl aminopeptidase
MGPSRTCAELEILEGSPAAVEADVLALPIFEEEDAGELAGFDDATGGEVARARASGEIKGKLFEVYWAGVRDTRWRPSRIVFIGAGPRPGFSTEKVRRVAAAASVAALQRRAERLVFVARGEAGDAEAAQAVAEGLTLGQFNPGQHKTQDGPGHETALAILFVPAPSAHARAAVARGCVLGRYSNIARGLANEPSNILTPRAFAKRSSEIAADAGLRVEVLSGGAMADLGMGLLLGVARGSAEPPRLVVLRYDPPNAPDRPVLGLVGKGITFDTGGISLKPADGMDRMKDDMAGGAAVVCAMSAMASLGAPIKVVGIVPATENMPGGRAIKPGDVLRSASGRTVEVVNTDAEGRLILADALWYAQRLGATHLFDVATLTGACVTALGKVTSGLFGTPDAWVEHVRQVAARAGDRAWPLPLFDDYAEPLRSEIADMVNSGGRPGAAITAAMFLKEFTGGLPWVHMDIAGTAWLEEPKPYQPKGATGVAVRTLAELPFTFDRWPV